MPSALSFSHADDLIAQLKTVDWSNRIDQIHDDPSREDCGLRTAVYTSVGSSTFRCLSHIQRSQTVRVV
jgi:hypothetical protein